MSDTSENTTATAEATEVAISRRALKALGEIPSLRCGALSPLARIAPPAEPADRGGLIDALASLEGAWQWLPPALLDPRLTVGMLFGDGDTSLIGQYLWPDAEGAGPGFRMVVEKDGVRLAGPLTREQVLLSCLDLVAFGGVAETETLRMTFTFEQFWATLALLDAYRIALLRRRLSRQGGYPAGVSAQGLAEAWKAGMAVADPGWSVSLFALLRPDLVPKGFEARVAAVVDGLEDAGLLAKLSGEPGDPLGDVYVLGEGLDLLCQAVMPGVVQVGLAFERARTAGETELTVLGGWRTPGGFWLADLSEIAPGRTGDVEVSLLGPHYFASVVDGLLGSGASAEVGADGEATVASFERAMPYSRDALVEMLRATPTPTPNGKTSVSAPAPAPASPTPPTTARRFCTNCGTELRSTSRFCTSCGQKLD